MKVKMYPHPSQASTDNGLGRVILKYAEYLSQFGVEIVEHDTEDYDLIASHAGAYHHCDVSHNHGLYWSSYAGDNADYHKGNLAIRNSVLYAKKVTVPSNWVAEAFKRDMHISPVVIPHAIEASEWEHDFDNEGYVLWNKNRAGDACDVTPVLELAKRFAEQQFISTFANADLPNVKITGKLPFAEMKPLIQKAGIYLATTKETFGIGTLEALASGVPVLGFDWGGTADIVTHKEDGYLVNPDDYDALAEGLTWLQENRDRLTENCKNTAMQYDWHSVVEKVYEVYKEIVE